MRSPRQLMAASLAALTALSLVACGGTDPEAGSGDSVKIALLWEIAGEGPNGLSDFQHGAELAIQEINEDGGIDGKTLEATRVAADPVDPQQSTAAFLKAADSDPVAMIGFLASGQATAAHSTIDRTQIPLLGIFEADESVRNGNQGSDFLWVMNGSGQGTSDAAVNYLADTLGLTSIGLMGTDEGFGLGQLDYSKKGLSGKGLTPVATATYSPAATDLTKEVLEMRGADAVINWGYPNPLAVQLKQFQENGLNIPTMTGASGPIVVANELASGKAINNFLTALPCNPAGTDSAELLEFNKRFEAKFGEAPSNLSAQAYDAVYVAKAAIAEAGTDPVKVNEVLSTLAVDTGDGIVCSSAYQADGSHVLNHQVNIAQYAADGTSKTVATLETPDLPKAGG